MIKIILPDERPIGWNKLLRIHHQKRALEVERVHWMVREYLDREACTIFEEPVDIQVLAYFEDKPLDPDNINAKFYIDALKGFLIQDDTFAFVNKVTTAARVDKDRPRVEIELTIPVSSDTINKPTG